MVAATGSIEVVLWQPMGAYMLCLLQWWQQMGHGLTTKIDGGKLQLPNGRKRGRSGHQNEMTAPELLIAMIWSQQIVRFRSQVMH